MNCPICKSVNPQFIYKFVDGPAMQHKLHRTLENALNERKVVINLYGCKECGFIFNADFNAKKTEYSSDYDNTQDGSKYFRSYLIKLAKRINKKYKLSSKKVVEVGCGKGHFIKILYDLGVKSVKGYDPSYINYDPLIDKLVTKKFFNEKNIDKKVDFIVCRHVLEHVQNPSQFMLSIKKCLADNGVIYFEFPDLAWIIKNEVLFDFFYEHCNYFSKRSLVYLFGQIGFKIIAFKYGLGGQYFQVEIRRGNPKNIRSVDAVDFNRIDKFLDGKIKQYKKLIAKLDRFIIWGAGAKGVTFLNRMNIPRNKCQYVIDINPNKQNKFIPITGQKIVSPEILQKTEADAIIIMNSVYEKEVKKTALQNGYRGKFISL